MPENGVHRSDVISAEAAVSVDDTLGGGTQSLGEELRKSHGGTDASRGHSGRQLSQPLSRREQGGDANTQRSCHSSGEHSSHLPMASEGKAGGRERGPALPLPAPAALLLEPVNPRSQ